MQVPLQLVIELPIYFNESDLLTTRLLRLEVKFKDNGIEGFEVIDDGSGIDPLNYESLGKKELYRLPLFYASSNYFR